tara:strand:- start:1596 stop:2120 length:525 start_codon:yes stop_codon:yes gene_type:complete
MKKWGRRGQFYLLMAIIIVAIIGGFIIVSNYSQNNNDVKIYYLGEELGIESENVIDYGTNNNEDLETLLENFTKTYSTYADTENLYFIFGNEAKITVAGYQALSSGNILIDAGSGNETLVLNEGIYGSKDFIFPQENIKVIVDGIQYDFSLKSGENFYFIISKEVESEKYVVTN